jgi:hypothetical protein
VKATQVEAFVDDHRIDTRRYDGIESRRNPVVWQLLSGALQNAAQN